MANTIKQKRGTSDPSASDLVVGELAINTTDGGVFTKTDGGSVVEVGGETNLGVSTTTTAVTVTSDTGNNATISQSSGSAAGVMSVAHHDKLDGIESNATADQSASEILTAIKTVDGAGSGLDADALDGVQGANYFNVEGKTKRWTVDLGDISYPTYYKVASVNQGSGGIHIKGSLNNHVESFGTSYFDLNIFGRENNNGANVVVSGTLGVSHPGTGLLVVKATDSNYDRYDVYVIVTRYTQASVDITKEGTATIDLSYASTTTKPTGLATEFDSGTTSQGLYVANDSSIYKMWNASNDGSGSGLDADLLDGQHGSHYLDYNNFSNTPTIPTNNNQLTNGASYVTSSVIDSLNASNLSSGTIPDARFPSTLPAVSGANLTNISATVASGAIYENSQNISANYSITSGKNAMSAGPITVDSGVTVTITSGCTWTVV